jgi:hypothetical protein
MHTAFGPAVPAVIALLFGPTVLSFPFACYPSSVLVVALCDGVISRFRHMSTRERRRMGLDEMARHSNWPLGQYY